MNALDRFLGFVGGTLFAIAGLVVAGQSGETFYFVIGCMLGFIGAVAVFVSAFPPMGQEQLWSAE